MSGVGPRFAQLERSAQCRYAIVAAEMAAEVWERGTPADGHEWVDGVGGIVIVPRSIVRKSVELARLDPSRWGQPFATAEINEVDWHLRAEVFDDLELPRALTWALRVASSLLSGVSVGFHVRTELEKDPLWRPVNQSITAVCLERDPEGGASNSALIHLVADEWWARAYGSRQ